MTDPALPDAFDAEVIAAVAEENGMDADAVADLVVRQQRTARDNPGVDDLVYEWRTGFHEDPLVERTGEAYYLRLRPHVWDEFLDHLDLTGAEREALLAVHDRQARAATGADPDGDRFMVLARE